ncbi:MAG: A/G-specific adenine glycosylase [Clostridia bacterium]|nr:A/G-specific adenine glycosylase [Clostridia bacterium]
MLSETAALLAWYDLHRRTMPWRGLRDPYAIWVSETMLQQTRVETVLGYFPRFMEAFPTLADLARAEEAEVLKQWEGLGYYSRARHLHAGARQVMAEYGGQLPQTAAALEKITGIGPYTAGAIASIAFGERVPAVDGNVIRVVSRLRGLRDSFALPETRRTLQRLAAELVPEERPGDFNQALMDLGAGLCAPGTPDCSLCPLKGFCAACASGDAEALPNLPQKKAPKDLPYDVTLILRGNMVLMRCRTERLLQGLWVYPMTAGHQEPEALQTALEKQTGLKPSLPRPIGEARHTFTHQRWLMRLWLTSAEEGSPASGWRFITLKEMQALALPTAMRAPILKVRQLLEALDSE